MASQKIKSSKLETINGLVGISFLDNFQAIRDFLESQDDFIKSYALPYVVEQHNISLNSVYECINAIISLDSIVDTIESKNANSEETIDDLNGKVSDLNTSINEKENKIDNLERDLMNEESEKNALEKQVRELEDAISDLSSENFRLESEITILERLHN